MIRAPEAGSAVARVKPKDAKLKKNPTKAVTTKLNPMEKVTLSIISIASFRGNSASLRQ